MGANNPLQRPWLFLAGGFIAIFGLLGMQEDPHWAFFMGLLLGLAAIAFSFGFWQHAAPPPARVLAAVAVPAPEPDLRERLHELDQLLADRVLSAAEHRRKRQALIAAWGDPPRGRPVENQPLG